ncbi:MAG: hypothetical protein GC181_09680 [Bacteroidetes bacterium]|nr:hypothetical protein [Bacteroidota bacterium]
MRRQFISLFLLIFTFFSGITVTFTGCSSIDNRYFKMLDTLDNRMVETRKLLLIDYKTIENRRDLIESHLRLIDMYVRDTMTPEFGMQLGKYEGVLKIYKNFLKNYSECLEETEELTEQAEDLRKAVESKEISKDSFKVYYAKETDDQIENMTRVRNLIKPVHSVEPDYQRISRMVNEYLTSLAAKDEDLARILKSLSDTTSK